MSWSPNMYRLMGYEPGEFAPTTERILERVHPSDRPQAETELDPRATSATPLELRVILPEGRVRHLHSAPGAGSGRPRRRMVGVVRDVTALRLAEREAELHGRVARALAGWQAFRSGGERLLAELAGTLSLPGASLWLEEEGSLVPRTAWREARPASEPEPGLRSLRTAAAERLATEARERGRAVRAPAGPGDGRRSASPRPALAVPAIGEDERAAGVILLYDHGSAAIDERLLAAVEQVGRTVGAFLGRRSGALGVPLTPRETEVLRLAAQGLSGSEIAGALQLSAATVKTHLAHTYAKIGAPNRVAAVAYALREGLIE